LAQQLTIHFYRVELAGHNAHRTKPAAEQHVLTLRRTYHYYSAGLLTQCLIELQLRDRLCMRTRISHQPIMTGWPCSLSETMLATGARKCRRTHQFHMA